MPILGLKIIDDLIAGFPDNARLRTQLGELRSQLAALTKENDELSTQIHVLKAQIQSFIPKTQRLDATEEAILRFIFDHHHEVSVELVAQQFHLGQSVIHYHFDMLIAAGLLEKTAPEVVLSQRQSRPAMYSITAEGRKHAFRNIGS